MPFTGASERGVQHLTHQAPRLPWSSPSVSSLDCGIVHTANSLRTTVPPSFKPHHHMQLLSRALGHIGKGAQCDRGVGKRPTSAHLGSDPNRLHDLFVRCALASSNPRVTVNAVGALGDVRYSDSDQLLRYLSQRPASEDCSTKCFKRIVDVGCEFVAAMSHLRRCNWKDRFSHNVLLPHFIGCLLRP